MRIKSLSVKNFRNFEDIKIELDNKNIFFGLNDVGKTNLLYAVRFLLDRKIRRGNFKETDFHKKDTSKKIEITLVIDSEFNGEESKKESKKIRKIINDNFGNTENNELGIKITSTFDKDINMGLPSMYYISDGNEIEMRNQGSFYNIDKYINIHYIDSSIDLDEVFSKNIEVLIKKEKENNNIDETGELNDVDNIVDAINTCIKENKGVVNIENDIATICSEELGIKNHLTFKSELSKGNIYKSLKLYLEDEDKNIYPTSGDGRKKILAYSLIKLFSKIVEDEKINLFLIEEPENHLHRSYRLSLSRIIFGDINEGDGFDYIFLTTHSSEILYEMDNTTLIRIFSEGDKITSKSKEYKLKESEPIKKEIAIAKEKVGKMKIDSKEKRKKVDDVRKKYYRSMKKRLNRTLSEAIFAKRVLLVEGPSELVLFNQVLSVVKPNYELDGYYILSVGGTYFTTYFNILDSLGIKVIIRTDNDLRIKNWTDEEKNSIEPDKLNKKRYELLGFTRCNKILKYKGKDKVFDEEEKLYDFKKKDKVKRREAQRTIFEENKEKISILNRNDIFLSKIDLENDLCDAIDENELKKFLDIKGGKVVNFLQESKQANMVILCDNIDDETCKKIYESKQFECLRNLVEEDFNK